MGLSRQQLIWILALAASMASAEEKAPAESGTPAPAPTAVPAPPTIDSTPRVYIPAGEPNIKKALLAIEPTEGGDVAAEFNQTLADDLDFSDLFEALPKSKMPGKKGDLDAYKVAGAEFLIRSSVSSGKNGLPEAELRLFDVARGVQILGRRYPLVSRAFQPGRELAHYAGNDVVQTLTGEPGIFRTRILMSCGRRTKEIWIMDFDGKNVRQLTRDGNFALSPSWAPDGHRMLFTSYKPAVKGGPLNPNLYMVDLATNNRRLLSAARGLNTGGSFHPKQNKIAYTFSQKGKAEIYMLDLASNTRVPVTKTSFFSVEANFSPDGNRLTYSSKETGRPHIYVANADGSAPHRLTFAGVYNSSPSWSPRGDRIAFSGQENFANNFNIFLIDPQGSNLVRLTSGASSNENPVWSPDGRFLAFSTNIDGSYRIYAMTSRGTRIRPLSPPNLGMCKQPSWSPRL